MKTQPTQFAYVKAETPMLQRQQNRQGIRSMKTTAFVAGVFGGLSLLPALAAVEPISANAPKDAWERSLEKIMSKEGIEMGGVFRAQYLFSSIGGPSALPQLRTEESVEFTSVDFDIKARPNTSTQGRVIFRMHQDWRNFFSDIANPIFTRWISLDGAPADGMFSYHAGDFRKHYSPLTLWSPDVEIPFEPVMFAQERRAAMDEVFLGNNDRLLQGVSLGMDAQIHPILSAAHVNLIGSRLRNVETNITNGSKVTAAIEKSPVEKFLGAANVDLTVKPGIDVGASYLNIFDKQGSYDGPTPAEPRIQLTQIIAGRAGTQLETLLNAKGWKLNLAAEFAQSTDDTAYIVTDADTATADYLKIEKISGNALRVDLKAGWAKENLFGLGLAAGYLKNDRDFRNEMAQSPTFLGERILNIENDSAKVRTNNSASRHYSSFDALYRTVFKFAPSTTTNMWHKAPFSKNSYSRAIMTQNEMRAAAASRMDSAVQLAMPFGPATANRVGPVVDLDITALEKNVIATVHWTSLKEVKAVDSAGIVPLATFGELGAGAKVDISGLAGMNLPLALTAYYGTSFADREGKDSTVVHRKATTQTMSAGLYWGFLKRFALMGGWMQFTTDYERGTVNSTLTQSRTAGGVEYRISNGAYVTGSVGQVSVERDDGFGDFHQLQTSLDMRVSF
jgi:hypothetical protein